MEKIEKNLRKNNIVKMTTEESNHIFSNIIKFIENYNPVISEEKYFTKEKSPYFSNIFKISGMVFASFLIFFIGGGISYEASTALPGDLLYSLKINTIEEVRGAFIKSPEEKLIYNQSRVAKRIDEVLILAEKGDLTIEKSVEVEKALDSHIAEIEAVAKELKETNPESFKTTTENLTPKMEQHKNELKEVSDKVEVEIKDTEKNIEVEMKTQVATEAGQIPNPDLKKDTVQMEKTEESKKAVDNIIAKIEQETDSIKSISEDTNIGNTEVKPIQ